MAKQTALGNLFAVHGIEDWEDVFPKQICAKCSHAESCKEDCAALITIGGMGAMIAGVDGNTAVTVAFAKNLRKVIQSP